MWICSWSGSCAGQPAVSIITCCCALSSWIFPPSTITSSYSINDHRRRQNSGPGVHLLPSRLLQLLVVRYVIQHFLKDPFDPERRRTSGHWDSSMWHRAGAASIALASCSSTSWLQGCMSGAPVTSGSDTGIPNWRHRPQRSAAIRTCFVPRTHDSFGDRNFSAAGRRVWNSLPPHLRKDMNFVRFQHELKNFCLGISEPRHIVTVCYTASQKYSYLLWKFCYLDMLLDMSTDMSHTIIQSRWCYATILYMPFRNPLVVWVGLLLLQNCTILTIFFFCCLLFQW